MVLEQNYKIFKGYADLLGDWKEMSLEEIANKYLATEDEDVRNMTSSALMCKCWKSVDCYVNSYFKNNPSVAIEIVWEGIEKALRGHVWTEKNVSANAAFSECIMSILGHHFTMEGYQKRKANSNASSLDKWAEDYEDFTGDAEGLSVEDTTKGVVFDASMVSLIKKFVENGRVDSALVVDNICYQDCHFNSSKLNRNKLVNNLKSFSEDYINYFVSKYSVDKEEVENCMLEMSYYKDNKVMGIIDKTLNRLRDVEAGEYLCLNA